jgi:hypothetical protein
MERAEKETASLSKIYEAVTANKDTDGVVLDG